MPLKISIITPCLNQASYIGQASLSVTNQHYPNTEYIILDAESTDGTAEIIRSIGEEHAGIIRWSSEPDEGQVDALNRGFGMATGEIIAFLNSDDFYLPGCFDTVSAYFERHPEKKWLVGNCGVLPPNLRWTFTFKHLWPVDKIKNIMYIFNFINQPAVFLRREFAQRVGLFDPRAKFSFDYDYWLRCLEFCLPGRITQDLAVFRVHEHAKSTNNYHEEFREGYAIASRYTRNKLLLFFHRVFIILVELIYREGKGK
jgi:glycosyltransferase involved in cell wall biosynthesis